MSKELTAIQILVKELESYVSNIKGNTDISTRMKKGVLIYPLSMAKHLLQKEQEQIEQAFDDGYWDKGNTESSTKYYQSKYGGEDVDRR